ncbi:hypothetical protein COF64_20780 [Bacillus sp. AFS043905]|uniref:hypothetical protein n=1 Tax=Peribacillus frigoritolerans TaxID=450367 RepID=UPI000BFCA785|nr:hypothetical protein [Peribacillus frigoritolerans]PHD72457.1 hypothetical protein COF64_20780 [Bacillus sp. AFS043905]TWE03308.1 hypothetical protein FB545_0366 [Peribacillus frigoritolerans]
MITKFETRYFYIISPYDDNFIKWNTVKGILSEDINDDYNVISDLMAMTLEKNLEKNMKFGKLPKRNVNKELNLK